MKYELVVLFFEWPLMITISIEYEIPEGYVPYVDKSGASFNALAK